MMSEEPDMIDHLCRAAVMGIQGGMSEDDFIRHARTFWQSCSEFEQFRKNMAAQDSGD